MKNTNLQQIWNLWRGDTLSLPAKIAVYTIGLPYVIACSIWELWFQKQYVKTT